MNSPLLELKSLSKFYGEFAANQNINFELKAGHIHALIGENGAGKSTLMKMIFGLETPSSGEIHWKGQELKLRSPQDAKHLGIGMVHQHFMQADNMTALSHLALETSGRGGFLRKLTPIPWPRLEKEAKVLSDRYGLSVPWHKRIHELSVIEQQRLEILKLLSQNAELLILDEPTAVLSPLEVKPFLEQLLELKKDGKTIILISHKLKEVLHVADEISVLRRGQMVWSGPASGKTEEELACLMIGANFKKSSERIHHKIQDAVCEVHFRELKRMHSNTTVFEDLKVHLHPGEVLGLAGVEGNGQSEFCEALLFPQRFKNETASHLTFKKLGWIPPDRHNQAVILPMKASENLLIGQLENPKVTKGPLVRWDKSKDELKQINEKFDVRPANGDLAMRSYSGGNQQKIVVGRECSATPDLLIAEHPTRGVDLAAAQRIHREFGDLAAQGKSVIVVSSDLDELIQNCDRILVFYRKNIQAEFKQEDFDSTRIGKAMAGLT